MANKGPLYGLSKDCKIKAEQKFDVSRAHDILEWMEAVLGRKLHDDIRSLQAEKDFAPILRDGVAMCELINTINPGAIKKINKEHSAFKQMENIEMFTNACTKYGMKAVDIFQMTDLYESKALYTVFNCLHALGSLAIKNGFKGPNYGVKISEKNQRRFSEEKLKEGKNVIPMQAGTNRLPSQAGMTPYGLSRQIIPSDSDMAHMAPTSQTVVSLQYGTNRKASQSGMTPYGLGRQIISMSSISDDVAISDVMSNSNDDVGPDDIGNDRDLSADDAFMEDGSSS